MMINIGWLMSMPTVIDIEAKCLMQFSVQHIASVLW